MQTITPTMTPTITPTIVPRISTIDMFTPAQTCRELCIDETTLLDMVNDARLPAYKIGGTIRFKIADVASVFALMAVA